MQVLEGKPGKWHKEMEKWILGDLDNVSATIVIVGFFDKVDLHKDLKFVVDSQAEVKEESISISTEI